MPVDTGNFILFLVLLAFLVVVAPVFARARRRYRNESVPQELEESDSALHSAMDDSAYREESPEEAAQFDTSLGELDLEVVELRKLLERVEAEVESAEPANEQEPFLAADDTVLVDLEGVGSLADEVVQSNDQRRADLQKALESEGECADWAQESPELVSIIEDLADIQVPAVQMPAAEVPIELEAEWPVKPEVEVPVEPEAELPLEHEVEVPVEPKAEWPVEPDDLKLIRGIGKVLEGVLNEKGIQTFEQLATLSIDDIESLSKELKHFGNRVVRDQWVEQAQVLVQSKSA